MWLSSHIIIIIIIIIAAEGITQVANLSLHLSYPLYSLSAKHFLNRPAHPIKLYMYVVVVANYHNWCYSPYLPSSLKPTCTPFSNICKTTTSRYASLSGVMWSVSLTDLAIAIKLYFYWFKPMESLP